MKKFLFRLSDAEARQNVLSVIRKHGLENVAIGDLRDSGFDFDSATPERIRQAGVIAVFESHRCEPAHMRRDAGKRDDEIIAELARAIGLIPVTERQHYVKYTIPYKKAYHTL